LWNTKKKKNIRTSTQKNMSASARPHHSDVTDKAFAASDKLRDDIPTISSNIDRMGEHIDRVKKISKDAVDQGSSGVRADVITSGMMNQLSTMVRLSLSLSLTLSLQKSRHTNYYYTNTLFFS
jgi:hypothetical protein